MQITIIAVGSKMPTWVTAGFNEYSLRMPKSMAIELREIALPKRGKNAVIEQLVKREGMAMAEKIPPASHIVALEVSGRRLTTPHLAERLAHVQEQASNLTLLIGGPDGLADNCRQLAHEQWSLSDLTLPHPLVRVLLAEQLYRAWTILQNHPYHR